MSTTTDKVKELGITKGEATAVDGTVYIDMASVVYTESPSRDWSEEHAMARLYCDAHNTAQKSGCLPSELLEQRDEAMKLASDAVDLIKVLANQIHSLPQNAVSALTHRTFSEMFDLRDGAAYGQARAIVDRLTRIKQGQP